MCAATSTKKKREPFSFLASQRAITSFRYHFSIGQVFWLLSFQYLFSNGSQVPKTIMWNRRTTTTNGPPQ